MLRIVLVIRITKPIFLQVGKLRRFFPPIQCRYKAESPKEYPPNNSESLSSTVGGKNEDYFMIPTWFSTTNAIYNQGELHTQWFPCLMSNKSLKYYTPWGNKFFMNSILCSKEIPLWTSWSTVCWKIKRIQDLNKRWGGIVHHRGMWIILDGVVNEPSWKLYSWKRSVFLFTLYHLPRPLVSTVWWKNWKIIRLTDHDTQILASYVK